MSFANALSVLRPTLPYYVALTKYGLLRITKDSFQFDPHPAAPPNALDMAKAVFTMGASACTESYVMSRTLAEGPKAIGGWTRRAACRLRGCGGGSPSGRRQPGSDRAKA
jgi:hypothetical protein